MGTRAIVLLFSYCLRSPFFGSGMIVENVHSSGHSPVSQIATHILCILSSAVCPALNSSAGTSSRPVARSHEQLLNEVVEALSPNILVQFYSLRHRGTGLHNTVSTFLRFVQTGLSDSLQCFDAVGWAAGRASGL